jgi:hypothetical protein
MYSVDYVLHRYTISSDDDVVVPCSLPNCVPVAFLMVARAIEAVIDIDPDLFEVHVNSDQEPEEPEEPEEQFLRGFVQLPAEVDAADVDIATLTLSVNDTILATAEYSAIVGNVLDVFFQLNLANVSTIIGLEATEVEVDDGKIKVNAKPMQVPQLPPAPTPPLPPIPPPPPTPQAPSPTGDNAGWQVGGTTEMGVLFSPQPIRLIELTVSGDLLGTGSFTGTDAVRVIVEDDD